MDAENARQNMIEKQIRTWGVDNARVLKALSTLPREDFVPAGYQSLAFGEMSIPLDHDQQMLTPCLEAKILQAVNIEAHENVLVIGTGSGYFSCLAAKLADQVTSVDIFESFSLEATKRATEKELYNITFETGNAAQGWASETPYDVIIVTGALPFLPEHFKQNLSAEGRIFALIGEGTHVSGTLIHRTGSTPWVSETLFETQAPMLLEATSCDRFVF